MTGAIGECVVNNVVGFHFLQALEFAGNSVNATFFGSGTNAGISTRFREECDSNLIDRDERGFYPDFNASGLDLIHVVRIHDKYRRGSMTC